MATKDRRAFAAVAGDDRSGTRIVAHERRSGALLWQWRVPEKVTGMVVRELASTIFTVGLLERGAGPPRLVTRALDAADGSQIWRRTDILGDRSPSPPALVQRADRLFLVGGSAERFLIHALDSSGRLRWRVAEEPGQRALAESLRVAFFGLDTLYVAGTRVRPAGEPSPMVAQAYDADGGQLLWEAELGNGLGTPRDILVSGRVTVFVAGETVDERSGLPRWTVHAVDAANGQHVWTDTAFPGRRASSTAAAITEVDPNVYVVGEVTRTRRSAVIRSYDRQGSLRWQRRGTSGRQGTFTDVDVHRLRGVVAVGSGRRQGERGDRAATVTFDPLDGSTVWKRYGPLDGVLRSIEARKRWVLAGGSVLRDGDRSDGLLQLYDVPSVFEDNASR